MLRIELTRSEKKIAEGFNEFSFDLLRKLNNESVSANNTSGDGEREDLTNFVVSPFGVAWGFAMIANGVSDDGALQEILTTLHLENETTADDINQYCGKIAEAFRKPVISNQLSLNSAFFYKSFLDINAEFLSAMKESYSARIFIDPTNQDFDQWISESTGGQIKEFAAKNDFARSHFGVLNNLHFKGVWAEPFNEKDTKLEPFYNSDGTISNVEMMTGRRIANVCSDDKCCLVDMSFRGGSLSMSFLIPSDNVALDDMISSLHQDLWDSLVDRVEKGRTALMMPKFEMENDLDLKDRIMEMGISRAFMDDGVLKKIDRENPLCLNLVRQAAVTKVDETGVKAAASTVVAGEYSGGYKMLMPININRPFLFMLREKDTGTILLMGKVGKL